MIFGGYFVDNVFNFIVFVNDKGGFENVYIFFVKYLFFFLNIIGIKYGLFGISN